MCRVKIVEDQNAETLRALEILHTYVPLHHRCILLSHTHALTAFSDSKSTARMPVASNVSLMAIPLVEKQHAPTASLKRKHPESSSVQTHQVTQQRSPVVPAAPVHAPAVVEKPRPRPLTASNPANAGKAPSVSMLPAAHYHFKVSMVDQRLFESGKKCLEIRSLHARFRLIQLSMLTCVVPLCLL